MIKENLIIYPKKLGILIPDDSAIALTMKFGPLPMYVIAPKNTAPIEIAFSNISGIPATILLPNPAITSVGSPVANPWNATAVGVLSRNELNKPVA